MAPLLICELITTYVSVSSKFSLHRWSRREVGSKGENDMGEHKDRVDSADKHRQHINTRIP